tara:strand:+ start:2662 stop:3072 length:411 start_codon:yes stop_codon:yes gene_type:complete
MLTELLAGLWIGNHEDAYNNEFYKDNLISIVINCTIDKSFCNIQNVKNVRIPVSNQTTTEDILHLQTNMDKILAFIHGNIEDNNILLFGYNNYTVPSIIVGSYMKKIGDIPIHTIKDILLSKNNMIQLNTDISLFV